MKFEQQRESTKQPANQPDTDFDTRLQAAYREGHVDMFKLSCMKVLLMLKELESTGKFNRSEVKLLLKDFIEGVAVTPEEDS